MRSAGLERVARVILPVGWLLAAVGYYGAWVAHQTAALTLSGADMGEFVKFLPGVLDGSQHVVRQLFYLPPVAVVTGVALLVGQSCLRYTVMLRLLALASAVPLSLQVLPPAWSPGSLLSAEFRLQTLSLIACWVLLAGFWLWGRWPLALNASLAAAVALAAAGLAGWQFLAVKPAIDSVYGTPPAIGWGYVCCLAGLAMMALSGAAAALHAPGIGSGR